MTLIGLLNKAENGGRKTKNYELFKIKQKLMMVIQEIKGEDYTVQYDANSVMVKFQGELALRGPKEYAPIDTLLKQIANDKPKAMTIDLKELAFLNSSGISMLSKFVLGIRKKKEIQLVVLGSNDIPWQGKSLKNLQKLLPSLKLKIE